MRARYIGPLIAADEARINDGTIIFSVGLGNDPVPNAAADCPRNSAGNRDYDPADPYQCPEHDYHVKTHFLARIANDQAAMAGDPGAAPVIPQHPDFPGTCLLGKAGIAVFPRGRFYQTPDPSELQALLIEIARNIKGRLYR